MEDMSYRDSDRMEQLIRENEELKKELKHERFQKETLIKVIMNRAEEGAERVFLGENRRLKGEIADLKNRLSDARQKALETGRLKETIRDLEEKLSILIKGRNWEAAVSQNISKSMGVSAQALCHAVKGDSVKEIVQKLDEEVTERTVYRALSVKEDTDLQRINTIVHQFPGVFRSHNVTETEVLGWFTALRVRRLRLVTREEVIRDFGEEALDTIPKDPYVQGEYYRI